MLVVSDSHLSPGTPEANSNWDAVCDLAGGYDLVVHVGDLTLNGTEDPGELVHARRLLDALGVPWIAVPGNHDIGDNPGASERFTVTGDRLEHWIDHIGPGHWSVEAGEWIVVGVNAQLFGSDLDEETQQWAWLENCLSRASGRPVVLVTHKPLTADADELAAAPSYRFVPEPARSRLTASLDDVGSRLVLSGHVHQYRTLVEPERCHVWAPTTWAVLPERLQRTIGVKRSGVVRLRLGPDASFEAELVEPTGLRQFTLDEDIASPYESY